MGKGCVRLCWNVLKCIEVFGMRMCIEVIVDEEGIEMGISVWVDVLGYIETYGSVLRCFGGGSESGDVW